MLLVLLNQLKQEQHKKLSVKCIKTITNVFYCLCFRLLIMFGVAFYNHYKKKGIFL